MKQWRKMHMNNEQKMHDENEFICYNFVTLNMSAPFEKLHWNMKNEKIKQKFLE